MRLGILGKSADQKGAQLEALTRRLLTRLGYKEVSLNVIAAGGNEIDIQAKYPVPGLQGDEWLRIIGECKARENPLSMPDWLQFLGKVFTEEAQCQTEIRAILISLSGINGNVRGSFEDICRTRKNITLVTGERLAELVIAEFQMASAESVSSYIRNAAPRTPVTEMSLGYFEHHAVWILQFSDGSFTVLEGQDVTAIPPDTLLQVVQAGMPGSSYRDLRAETESRQCELRAKKSILSHLLLRDGAVRADDLSRQVATEPESRNLSAVHVAAAIRALIAERVIVAECDGQLRLGDVRADMDLRVAFLQILTEEFVIPNLFGTAQMLGLVDGELLDRILSIQGELPMPSQHRSETIQLLAWSPRGLAWALRPDPMIVRHRKDTPASESPASEVVDRNDVRYFRAQLLRRVVEDFGEGALSSMYFERLGLRELEFSMRAEFKSAAGLQLDAEVSERHGIARAAAELGGGLVHVWLVEDAPPPWKWYETPSA